MGTATTTPAPTGELAQLKWGLFYEPGLAGLDLLYNYEENTVVTNMTECLMRLTPQLRHHPVAGRVYNSPTTSRTSTRSARA